MAESRIALSHGRSAAGLYLPDAAFETPTKEKMEHLKGILREIGISLADFK